MNGLSQIQHKTLWDHDLSIPTLDFKLPGELAASRPPEARGLSRDGIRLMVSHYMDDRILHSEFYHLPDFLKEGDTLVINTSATMNAAMVAKRGDGTPLELHLSTELPSGEWIVELRKPKGDSTVPYYGITPGEVLQLPEGGSVKVLAPYRGMGRSRSIEKKGNIQIQGKKGSRLWRANLHLPDRLDEYLSQNGFPISYDYVKGSWPSSYYQTVYATETGSAEMPSAGRAFTPELITQLVAQGIQVAPLILHTGVASLESHEPPYDEYYRVPDQTAAEVNTARARGKRVIAVGTTVIRALETVTDKMGKVDPGEGWTDVIVTPSRGIRSVNALLTGFHEPSATHLSMLEALAGPEHLGITYSEALSKRYLWHEFGDLHLILP